MKTKHIVLIFLLIGIGSCKSKILYDRTYLIFIEDKTWESGNQSLRYEIYKIDGSYDNFASGKSGITANAIHINPANEAQKKHVLARFKKDYPDSRIYVNQKLYL